MYLCKQKLKNESIMKKARHKNIYEKPTMQVFGFQSRTTILAGSSKTLNGQLGGWNDSGSDGWTDTGAGGWTDNGGNAWE